MVALQAFCNTLKTSYHEFATPHYKEGGICKKGVALITVRKALEKSMTIIKIGNTENHVF